MYEYIYKCNNCHKEFNSSLERVTTYESYYGVYSQFNSHTPLTLKECPYCKSDDIEKKDSENND